MSRKVMSEVDFTKLSRNELYRLCTIAVYAMDRMNNRLKQEKKSILDTRRARYVDLIA